MRRPLALAVAFAAVLVSGCAVGDPKPVTYVSDVSVTLNGDVYSSVSGDTEYFWRYGETSTYDSATPHRTIAISDAAPHPVSEPLAGLTAGTTYHYGMCVADSEESPPRVNCSTDRTFTTGTEAGTSGIAFSRASTIWRMGAGGEDPVALTDQGARAWPAWSPDGRRIAFTAQLGSTRGIVVMDADGGNQVNLTPDLPIEFAPQWSPDGSKIAFFSDSDGDPEIYVMDADGGNVTNLTDNEVVDQWPSWSPDGRRIAFSSRRDNPSEDIYVMNADGSSPVRLTDGPVNGNVAPMWSPNGRKIAFVAGRDFNDEVYVMDADGSNETNLSNSAASDAVATWSPDGSKIAFQSVSGGESEILVMSADGSDVTNITNDPANDATPAWSPRP